MSNRIIPVACLFLAMPILAQADTIAGLYVGAGAGGTVLRDQGVERQMGGYVGRLDAGLGPMGTASVGWGLGNGIRLELQGDLRSDRLHGSDGFRAGGEEFQLGGFVNAFYDVEFGKRLFGLTPYVGAGVGYERTSLDGATASGTLSAPGGPAGFYAHSGSVAGSFAAQAIVGAAYPVPGIPGLSATADYRFTALPDRRDARAQVFAGGAELHASGGLAGTSEQAFTFGLRYTFGSVVPAPASTELPPVAMHQQAHSRTYLVFFDWDRSDLTDRARQIVALAARQSTETGLVQIEVDGHTDASGTKVYNQALSVRRATTVAAELVRDGVPSASITVHGMGESAQLVRTAPGQREPQNRRVEIILR